jgi:hypothetical protein
MEGVMDAVIGEQAFESRDDASEMKVTAVAKEHCAPSSESQDDVARMEECVVLPEPHRVSA